MTGSSNPVWRLSSERTERTIRAAFKGHLIDEKTGEFQVHAAGIPGNALLETGGIWVETLSWLYSKTGKRDLIRKANGIARFSFRDRNKETDLIQNHPTGERWDKYASTTEVGLWAGCLLRAAEHTGNDEWVTMADKAISSWLRFGYDAQSRNFFGKLEVATGRPLRDAPATPYEPGEFSDVWNPKFPSHDYPMPFAESCLKLWVLTGKSDYRIVCERWVNIIQASLPARQRAGGYAEQYGQNIHFLLKCAQAFDDEAIRDLAGSTLQEGLEVLHESEHGMFRGHPDEHRYDAVDGVGYFLIVLLALHSGKNPDMIGSGW